MMRFYVTSGAYCTMAGTVIWKRAQPFSACALKARQSCSSPTCRSRATPYQRNSTAPAYREMHGTPSLRLAMRSASNSQHGRQVRCAASARGLVQLGARGRRRHGLAEAPLDKAAFVAISGLNRDDETPADYADILRLARDRNLDLLCANPDIVVQFGKRMIWCAGAIARDYASLGGRVIMAGKPYAPIYDLALAELAAIRTVRRDRILCIGDGIPTDIAGASIQGFDSLFIASGMHGEALWTEGKVDPEKVDLALAEENVRATYAMTALR